MSNDELSPEERRRLDGARLVPDVSEARRARIRRRLEAEVGPLRAASDKPRRWLGWGAAAVAIAAAVLLWVVMQPPNASGELGDRDQRSTIAVGTRALAVAESHSVLQWQQTQQATVVEQQRGRVFYRVEPGGPFVVRTPVGEVAVTGTSFEVEITMSQSSRTKSMALGAALAAAAVVTVYEGRVVLANEGGTTEVNGGQRAALRADGSAPLVESRVAVAEESLAPVPVNAVVPTDAAVVTQLRARVRDLEGQLQAVASDDGDADEGDFSDADRDAQTLTFYNPSAEQLVEAAGRCELAFAAPGRDRSGKYISDKVVDKLGLSSEERATVVAAIERREAQWQEALRQMYVDATGDDASVDSLSIDAMSAEIRDKAAASELTEARRLVSAERAGLSDPDAVEDPTPAVRYYRGEVARSKSVFDDAAATLGSARATELLGHLSSDMAHQSGCD